MEGNENKTNSIDEFVGEFETFRRAIRQKAGRMPEVDIGTLTKRGRRRYWIECLGIGRRPSPFSLYYLFINLRISI